MKLSSSSASAAAAAVRDSFFSWGRLDVPKSQNPIFSSCGFEFLFGSFLLPISIVFFNKHPSTRKSRRDLRRTDDDADRKSVV